MLRPHFEMGLLVGFKLRLARSTVLRRRSPVPPTPALGRRAGGYNFIAALSSETRVHLGVRPV